KLAEVIDVSFDIVTNNGAFVAPTASNKQGSLGIVGTLSDLISANGPVADGVLLPSGETKAGFYSGEIVVCVSLHMREDAGNEYQDSSIGTTFDIKLHATQYNYESDSFGNHYDEVLDWPDLPSNNNTAEKDITTDESGLLLSATSMANEEGNISVYMPAGVKFDTGVSKAIMNVHTITESEANITLSDGQQTKSYDVHIAGVAADNTTPIQVVIEAMLPVGLNAGNFDLYHVENGETVTMTALGVYDDPAHNTFRYDPATGDVTLYMASFSEVALVAGEAIWNGTYDYSWYNSMSTMLTISNADQLAGFGAIVGGMAKDENGNYIVNIELEDGSIIHYDSFKGKTVRLGACIHIGDTDENYTDASENGIILYPIGYYNNTGSYEKKPGNVGPDGAAVVSGYRTFEGTFDGYGHEVSDWYQNTWEMFGDYNSGYSGTPNHNRDGMGLFGRVYGGTIKNLTITNFSSDGEYSTTGCVAAYADHGATFENIAIVKCNPRVYNIGNGGVVGVVGWYNKGVTEQPVTFKNVTVDNSNKISALWGSWDVACGGIVGTYYPTSGQSAAGYPANAGISFENCHVGAQIDVYNDVCANYQYYAYRYSGMMIGSVAENVTIDGHEYPKMDGLTFNNCTVHFGDWNDYYYCELVANSLASYTHDHQMSRLVQVLSVDVEKMTVTPLKGETTAIPTSGRVNYVVVKAKDDNGKWIHGDGHDYAECYHFVNGVQHFHDVADSDNPTVYETVNEETVLKEDKQLVYREFNNLVTGDGWGVTSKGIGEVTGVTILDRAQANSVEKFEGKIVYPISGRTYKLSHIFNFVDNGVPVINGSVDVTITNLDKNGNVTAEFNRDPNNWGDGTLTLNGKGAVRITIQDYYYCTRTAIEVIVRNYPEGSVIQNYTYDGFIQTGTTFTFNENADRIENGKHGKYTYDFGFGTETFEYAIKMDSNNFVKITPARSGTIVIAFASNTAGATLEFRQGNNSKFTDNTLITTGVAHQSFALQAMYVNVTANTTYQIMRGKLESGIYYIGYLPDGTTDNFEHKCSLVVVSTTATCEKAGVETLHCLVCGTKKGEVKRDVPAYGHNIVIDAGKPATCNNNGEKDGQHCTRCNDKTVKKESISKLGHTYVNSICKTCGGYNLDYSNQKYSYQMNFISDSYATLGDKFKAYGSFDINSGNKCLVLYPKSDTNESYIEFTTSNSNATLVVVAASTGYGNTSVFQLQDANGNVVATTTVTHAEGTTFAYTLQANTTYRLVCVDENRQVRIQFMGVTSGVNAAYN
ncbi:MAG: hypothetical protein IKV43_05920, partial [Clostridia bacterium]|nr:hypothetical protein [Clostridia bacterium]